MRKSEQLRRELVEQLRAARAVRSDAVAEAFLAVPRERFIPEAAKSEGLEAIYKDAPVPTKWDQRGTAVSSSSQPAIMAQMLELLDVKPGQRVLEIGTGTGYNAALLSTLVGSRGRVVSVELDPDLAELAQARLAEGRHRLRVVAGDGRRGFEGRAPYDRVIVTASTVDVPVAWRDQLSGDGILVTPLRIGGMGVQVVAALRRTGRRASAQKPRYRPGGPKSEPHSANSIEPTRRTTAECVSDIARLDAKIRHPGAHGTAPSGRGRTGPRRRSGVVPSHGLGGGGERRKPEVLHSLRG